ncbi:MAG: zinc ribbon domain-containing protein [Candidatus Aminicenantes bacterium]|nr:zinc ribbon domain-containing protein [Candidatus Aminicenantes bacterium]
MPLYEYKCNECEKTFEVLQKIDASPLEQCIHCKGGVEKLISVSSFQFKGSGWYITDYKNKNKKAKSDSKTTDTGINKNATIK